MADPHTITTVFSLLCTQIINLGSRTYRKTIHKVRIRNYLLLHNEPPPLPSPTLNPLTTWFFCAQSNGRQKPTADCVQLKHRKPRKRAKLKGSLTNFLGLFSDVNECSANPCKNGAKCTNTHGDYKCACDNRFTGKNCDQGT